MSDETRNRGGIVATLVFSIWLVGIAPVYTALRQNGEAVIASSVIAPLWPVWIPIVVAEWFKAHHEMGHTSK